MSVTSVINRVVPVLYEDEWLLAVAKPAGVDVGGRRDEEAVGIVEDLVQLRGGRVQLLPVNRLSRFESGLLLLARDRNTAESLKNTLKSRKIEQTYMAVIQGKMTKQVLTISSAHGASRGQRGRESETSRRRQKELSQTATRKPPSKADSVTTVTRLDDLGKSTLVRCVTTASTTHAFRAQLRAAGLRLRGDLRGGPTWRAASVEETYLHLTSVTLQHPAKGSKITIKAPGSQRGSEIGSEEFRLRRVLLAGLARRLPCLDDKETDAYRLLTGPAEGMESLTVERFGDVVVLQIKTDRALPSSLLRTAATYYRDILGIHSVYVKWFAKNREALGEELLQNMFSSTPLLGSPAPPQIEIRERGLFFAIRPYDGFSVGLYLDQRDNRTRIRKSAEGKNVLNLFAYTCGFSLAAAAGRARSTTSVDLSPKYLEWGKANFRLNHFDPNEHEFIATDAMHYLAQAKAAKRQFDIIVVDAPTFAHGRKAGKSFSIVEDLVELLKACVDILAPDGLLMVSTNHRRTSHRALRERVRQAAGKRPFKITDTPPLPVDFTIDPDHAKTVFARFA